MGCGTKPPNVQFRRCLSFFPFSFQAEAQPHTRHTGWTRLRWRCRRSLRSTGAATTVCGTRWRGKGSGGCSAGQLLQSPARYSNMIQYSLLVSQPVVWDQCATIFCGHSYPCSGSKTKKSSASQITEFAQGLFIYRPTTKYISKSKGVSGSFYFFPCRCAERPLCSCRTVCARRWSERWEARSRWWTWRFGTTPRPAPWPASSRLSFCAPWRSSSVASRRSACRSTLLNTFLGESTVYNLGITSGGFPREGPTLKWSPPTYYFAKSTTDYTAILPCERELIGQSNVIFWTTGHFDK